MTNAEIIWLATFVISKRLDYEEFMYREEVANCTDGELDEVWYLVEECREIGESAFKKKYRDYTLYF